MEKENVLPGGDSVLVKKPRGIEIPAQETNEIQKGRKKNGPLLRFWEELEYSYSNRGG